MSASPNLDRLAKADDNPLLGDLLFGCVFFASYLARHAIWGLAIFYFFSEPF